MSEGFLAMISKQRLKWLIVVFIIGIGGDQASKIMAQSYLAEPYEVMEQETIDGVSVTITRKIFYPIKVIEVIPHFMNFIYKENPAAAFSLTRTIPTWFRRPMLISVSLFATLFFMWWYFRIKARDGLLLASFSFILAGAIGNLLDRIRLGYVIDFIDVHAGLLSYPHLHWPTFNVADSLIVIGAVGVIFRTLRPLPATAEG